MRAVIVTAVAGILAGVALLVEGLGQWGDFVLTPTQIMELKLKKEP